MLCLESFQTVAVKFLKNEEMYKLLYKNVWWKPKEGNIIVCKIYKIEESCTLRVLIFRRVASAI